MRDVPAISRRTALGAGAVLLAGAAGCAPARDPREISLWNFYGPGGQNKSQSDWISRLAAEWNATHEVRVRLRYVPNKDYKAGPTLQTSFSAGAGPDVFLLSPGDFLRYYNGGALADLTPHLEPGVREDFLPEVLATRLVDDRVYGLPMEIEPLALFYSEDAFERAGLAEGDLPGTWDELLGLAERLTTPDRFGMLFETNPGYYQNFTWYPWLWMAGGDVFTPDLRRSAFDSTAAHRAMRLWQDAVRSGAAPRRVRGEGGNDTISNLAQGYCAMQQLGIWASPRSPSRRPVSATASRRCPRRRAVPHHGAGQLGDGRERLRRQPGGRGRVRGVGARFVRPGGGGADAAVEHRVEDGDPAPAFGCAAPPKPRAPSTTVRCGCSPTR
ncbi:ABC transporter substrate-binding protein [Saccharopolyspora gregorii]|uniref:Extracellular solute-binding protein n=1 Tax=Saccharopolyspora gregorii TaxID=33914 RepID=A0ABP6S2R1_9PSEU